MKINIAVCLLGLALLPACQTTTKTTRNERDFKGLTNRYASTNREGMEPAAPAEGPSSSIADIPAEGPADLVRNPAIMPTPLLRSTAAGTP